MGVRVVPGHRPRASGHRVGDGVRGDPDTEVGMPWARGPAGTSVRPRGGQQALAAVAGEGGCLGRASRVAPIYPAAWPGGGVFCPSFAERTSPRQPAPWRRAGCVQGVAAVATAGLGLPCETMGICSHFPLSLPHPPYPTPHTDCTMPTTQEQADLPGLTHRRPPPAPPYLPGGGSGIKHKRRPGPQAVFLLGEPVQEHPAPASFLALCAGSVIPVCASMCVRAPPPRFRRGDPRPGLLLYGTWQLKPGGAGCARWRGRAIPPTYRQPRPGSHSQNVPTPPPTGPGTQLEPPPARARPHLSALLPLLASTATPAPSLPPQRLILYFYRHKLLIRPVAFTLEHTSGFTETAQGTWAQVTETKISSVLNFPAVMRESAIETSLQK
ncbi:uncharacterized protein [Vicugna pacos]|uniref:Uncharacterized protein n=1 Tax=Vicugna pacos TaxID=30538 RepID=A0ABM5E9Z7_VICPA